MASFILKRCIAALGLLLCIQPKSISLAQPDTLPTLLRVEQQHMATVYEIAVIPVIGEAQSRRVIDDAYAEIARLETLLSEWMPGAEISQINRNAGLAAVKVSPETLEVIQMGQQTSKWTRGAYDLSWAALWGLYRFDDPIKSELPDPAVLRERIKLIRWQDILVDPRASTVRLKRKGMAIGTGGIAKGYALDRARDILKAGGLQSFMIFGGGQVLIEGPRGPGRGWRVGIQHPRKREYVAYVEGTHGSIATSGDYEHFFMRDGKRWHHIVDPKTGYPSEGVMSVTLIAENGFIADAVDTGCFIMKAERCLEMLKKIPGKPEAVIITSDRRFITTPGTLKKLVFNVTLDSEGRIPE